MREGNHHFSLALGHIRRACARRLAFHSVAHACTDGIHHADRVLQTVIHNAEAAGVRFLIRHFFLTDGQGAGYIAHAVVALFRIAVRGDVVLADIFALCTAQGVDDFIFFVYKPIHRCGQCRIFRSIDLALVVCGNRNGFRGDAQHTRYLSNIKLLCDIILFIIKNRRLFNIMAARFADIDNWCINRGFDLIGISFG